MLNGHGVVHLIWKNTCSPSRPLSATCFPKMSGEIYVVRWPYFIAASLPAPGRTHSRRVRVIPA